MFVLSPAGALIASGTGNSWEEELAKRLLLKSKLQDKRRNCSSVVRCQEILRGRRNSSCNCSRSNPCIGCGPCGGGRYFPRMDPNQNYSGPDFTRNRFGTRYQLNLNGPNRVQLERRVVGRWEDNRWSGTMLENCTPLYKGNYPFMSNANIPGTGFTGVASPAPVPLDNNSNPTAGQGREQGQYPPSTSPMPVQQPGQIQGHGQVQFPPTASLPSQWEPGWNQNQLNPNSNGNNGGTFYPSGQMVPDSSNPTQGVNQRPSLTGNGRRNSRKPVAPMQPGNWTGVPPNQIRRSSSTTSTQTDDLGNFPNAKDHNQQSPPVTYLAPPAAKMTTSATQYDPPEYYNQSSPGSVKPGPTTSTPQMSSGQGQGYGQPATVGTNVAHPSRSTPDVSGNGMGKSKAAPPLNISPSGSNPEDRGQIPPEEVDTRPDAYPPGPIGVDKIRPGGLGTGARGPASGGQHLARQSSGYQGPGGQFPGNQIPGSTGPGGQVHGRTGPESKIPYNEGPEGQRSARQIPGRQPSGTQFPRNQIPGSAGPGGQVPSGAGPIGKSTADEEPTGQHVAGQSSAGQATGGQLPGNQVPGSRGPGGQVHGRTGPESKIPYNEGPEGQRSARQIPGRQPSGTQFPRNQIPDDTGLIVQVPSGAGPIGKSAADKGPGGQHVAGQSPGGQATRGQFPGNQIPGSTGPGGQVPSSAGPIGKSTAGEIPRGQHVAGQSPGGQATGGQFPGDQTPSGTGLGVPARRDTGQQSKEPGGLRSPGQIHGGQLPGSQHIARQTPQGQLTGGQFPERQIPGGTGPGEQVGRGKRPEDKNPSNEGPEGQRLPVQKPGGQLPIGQFPGKEIPNGLGQGLYVRRGTGPEIKIPASEGPGGQASGFGRPRSRGQENKTPWGVEAGGPELRGQIPPQEMDTRPDAYPPGPIGVDKVRPGGLGTGAREPASGGQHLARQSPGGQATGDQFPGNQVPGSPGPGGQVHGRTGPESKIPYNEGPEGQGSARQIPGLQPSGTQFPRNQIPGSAGPGGQVPSGAGPIGKSTADEEPTGQHVAGQSSAGQATGGQFAGDQTPSGTGLGLPARRDTEPQSKVPAIKEPGGLRLPGQSLGGQLLGSKHTAGQSPQGQLTGGKFPERQILGGAGPGKQVGRDKRPENKNPANEGPEGQPFLGRKPGGHLPIGQFPGKEIPGGPGPGLQVRGGAGPQIKIPASEGPVGQESGGGRRPRSRGQENKTPWGVEAGGPKVRGQIPPEEVDTRPESYPPGPIGVDKKRPGGLGTGARGPASGGQHLARQSPGYQRPGGQFPGNQVPGSTGPGGQVPSGAGPIGRSTADEGPGGQHVTGQSPGGQATGGQYPGDQTPLGKGLGVPARRDAGPHSKVPASKKPGDQRLPGQSPGGQLPGSQYIAGQGPQGQLTGGQFPERQIPGGGGTGLGKQVGRGKSPEDKNPANKGPEGQRLPFQKPGGQLPIGQLPGKEIPSGPGPGLQVRGGAGPQIKTPASEGPGGQASGGGRPRSRGQGNKTPWGVEAGGPEASGQIPPEGVHTRPHAYSPGPIGVDKIRPGGLGTGAREPALGGQHLARQSPGYERPGGQFPGNQIPDGTRPIVQIPSGAGPIDKSTADKGPGGQHVAGQNPGGLATGGRLPGSQHIAGQSPQGQLTGGQFPERQIPGGGGPGKQVGRGKSPEDKNLANEGPEGQRLPGLKPLGQLPIGQFPGKGIPSGPGPGPQVRRGPEIKFPASEGPGGQESGGGRLGSRGQENKTPRGVEAGGQIPKGPGKGRPTITPILDSYEPDRRYGGQGQVPDFQLRNPRARLNRSAYKIPAPTPTMEQAGNPTPPVGPRRSKTNTLRGGGTKPSLSDSTFPRNRQVPEVPKAQVPKVQVSKEPQVQVSNIQVHQPKLQVSKIQVPQPKVQVSKVQVPQPKVQVSKVQVPQVLVPQVQVQVPTKSGKAHQRPHRSPSRLDIATAPSFDGMSPGRGNIPLSESERMPPKKRSRDPDEVEAAVRPYTAPSGNGQFPLKKPSKSRTTVGPSYSPNPDRNLKTGGGKKQPVESDQGTPPTSTKTPRGRPASSPVVNPPTFKKGKSSPSPAGTSPTTGKIKTKPRRPRVCPFEDPEACRGRPRPRTDGTKRSRSPYSPPRDTVLRLCREPDACAGLPLARWDYDTLRQYLWAKGPHTQGQGVALSPSNSANVVFSIGQPSASHQATERGRVERILGYPSATFKPLDSCIRRPPKKNPTRKTRSAGSTPSGQGLLNLNYPNLKDKDKAKGHKNKKQEQSPSPSNCKERSPGKSKRSRSLTPRELFNKLVIDPVGVCDYDFWGKTDADFLTELETHRMKLEAHRAELEARKDRNSKSPEPCKSVLKKNPTKGACESTSKPSQNVKFCPQLQHYSNGETFTVALEACDRESTVGNRKTRRRAARKGRGKDRKSKSDLDLLPASDLDQDSDSDQGQVATDLANLKISIPFRDPKGFCIIKSEFDSYLERFAAVIKAKHEAEMARLEPPGGRSSGGTGSCRRREISSNPCLATARTCDPCPNPCPVSCYTPCSGSYQIYNATDDGKTKSDPTTSSTSVANFDADKVKDEEMNTIDAALEKLKKCGAIARPRAKNRFLFAPSSSASASAVEDSDNENYNESANANDVEFQNCEELSASQILELELEMEPEPETSNTTTTMDTDFGDDESDNTNAQTDEFISHELVRFDERYEDGLEYEGTTVVQAVDMDRIISDIVLSASFEEPQDQIEELLSDYPEIPDESLLPPPMDFTVKTSTVAVATVSPAADVTETIEIPFPAHFWDLPAQLPLTMTTPAIPILEPEVNEPERSSPPESQAQTYENHRVIIKFNDELPQLVSSLKKIEDPMSNPPSRRSSRTVRFDPILQTQVFTKDDLETTEESESSDPETGGVNDAHECRSKTRIARVPIVDDTIVTPGEYAAAMYRGGTYHVLWGSWSDSRIGGGARTTPPVEVRESPSFDTLLARIWRQDGGF